MIGPLCGLGVTLWISIGAYSKRYGVPMLPSDISNCTAGPANYTYRPPTTRDELLVYIWPLHFVILFV